MNILLPYDTETTGLPVWSSPSDSDEQPHLVQLAAQLINGDTREAVQSIDLIVKPDGWSIPAVTTEIHGITEEMAHDVGVPEKEAVDIFLQLWGMGRANRIAYNKTFDQRIIRIALKRYFGDDVLAQWAEKDDHFCAMQMAKKVIGGKNPKLVDAYRHFTGNEMSGAHSAMGDTVGCAAVYWAAKDALGE